MVAAGRSNTADSPTTMASSSNSGVIYGGGLNWRPTERTAVDGYWEHRFFGSSYNWQVSHRLPNLALSANFTRGLSTFPQLALASPLNFYDQSITLQQTASLSAVWAGLRNALGFTLFNSRTDEISGTGSALPSVVQFGAS